MKNASLDFGLSVALATPFQHDLDIDTARMIDHARWCLDNGCQSITLFGTTGEGASVSSRDKQATCAAFAAAGFTLETQVICCIFGCDVQRVAEEARLALDNGCRAILLAPPFYFKDVTEQGVLNWFRRVFDHLGATARDVILYNIPQSTGVSLSPRLVRHLLHDYSGVVVAVKESSGNWKSTMRLLELRTQIGIFMGDERHLSHALTLGASGAISGLANVIPNEISNIRRFTDDDRMMFELKNRISSFTLVGAIKSLISHRTGDSTWHNIRPPLEGLTSSSARSLISEFEVLRDRHGT